MKHKTKVIYNNQLRTIYDVYPDNMASLCLIDEEDIEYEDVEEDFLVPVKDLKIVPKTIKVNVRYYLEEFGGNVKIDFERMAEEFEQELSKLNPNAVVMCSIEND